MKPKSVKLAIALIKRNIIINSPINISILEKPWSSHAHYISILPFYNNFKQVMKQYFQSIADCYDSIPNIIFAILATKVLAWPNRPSAVLIARPKSNWPKPLIQATRQEFEAKLAQKEADVSKREATLKAQQRSLEDAQKTIDEQVASKLKAERVLIATEEGRKARLALANDLEAKSKELVELQEILQQRNNKLEEAQKAQADLIRKQRELDDAKRELDLTVEKRLQESIALVRQKAKQEAEDGLRLKVSEKEEQIASMAGYRKNKRPFS